jgi:hypothetical protein
VSNAVETDMPMVDLAYINENYYTSLENGDSTPLQLAWTPEHRLSFELTDQNTRQQCQNVTDSTLFDLDAFKGLVPLGKFGAAYKGDIRIPQKLSRTSFISKEKKTKVRRLIDRNGRSKWKEVGISKCPHVYMGSTHICEIGDVKIYLVFPDLGTSDDSKFPSCEWDLLKSVYLEALDLECDGSHEGCQFPSVPEELVEGFKYSFALTEDAVRELDHAYLKVLPNLLLPCFCSYIEQELRECSVEFGQAWIYLHSFGSKDSTMTSSVHDMEDKTANILDMFNPSLFLSLNVDVAVRHYSLTQGVKLTAFAKRSSIEELDFQPFHGYVYPQAMTHDIVNYQADYSNLVNGVKLSNRGAVLNANFYSGKRQRLAPEGAMPLETKSKLASSFVFRPLLPALHNIWGVRYQYWNHWIQKFEESVDRTIVRIRESSQHNLPFRFVLSIYNITHLKLLLCDAN